MSQISSLKCGSPKVLTSICESGYKVCEKKNCLVAFYCFELHWVAGINANFIIYSHFTHFIGFAIEVTFEHELTYYYLF